MKGGNYVPHRKPDRFLKINENINSKRRKDPLRFFKNKYYKNKALTHKKATISPPVTSHYVAHFKTANPSTQAWRSTNPEIRTKNNIGNLLAKHDAAKLETAWLMNQDSSGIVVNPKLSTAELAAKTYRNTQFAAQHPDILNAIKKYHNNSKIKEIEKFRQGIKENIASIPNNATQVVPKKELAKTKRSPTKEEYESSSYYANPEEQYYSNNLTGSSNV